MDNTKISGNPDSSEQSNYFHHIYGKGKWTFPLTGMRLVFCENGKAEIESKAVFYTLDENSFILFEGEHLNQTFALTKDDGGCIIFDFLPQKGMLHNLSLEEKTVYRLCIKNELEKISEFLSIYPDTKDNTSVLCKINSLFLDINQKLFSKTLAPEIIGKNGFSVDGVGKRECGYFHGKYCCRVISSGRKNDVVVLENHDISDMEIDLKQYKYIKINYFYENPKGKSSFARVRFLSYINENGDFFWYRNNKRVFHEAFARLEPGKWKKVIIPTNIDDDCDESFSNNEKCYLKQMKFDPYGARTSNSIENSEKIHISSIIFMKKISHTENSDAKHNTERINTVLNLINDNFKENFELDFYAEKVFLSVSRFREWFKLQTGVAPHKYILYKKIEYAKMLLMSSKMSVSEIASSTGFNDTHYFSRLFKKYTGVSPNQYRK